MTDTARIQEALDRARDAYSSAIIALEAAETAARAAGLDVSPRELTLERLRIVEADGTLRLVLGNSTVGATIPMRGSQTPHPGRSAQAGLLFVNDEGTECGGLMWSGHSGRAGLGMSFDSFEQNDALLLRHGDEDGRRMSMIEFVDRPTWSLVDLIADLDEAEDKAAVRERYLGEGAGHSRMRLARETDGSVVLALKDGCGRDRIRMAVPADGTPTIEVLDEEGNPAWSA